MRGRHRGGARRHESKKLKEDYVPAVCKVDITSYDNEDNVVDLSFRSRDGSERILRSVVWGGSRSPVAGESYLCRFSGRGGSGSLRLFPMKRLMGRSEQEILVVSRKGSGGWEFYDIEKKGSARGFGLSGGVETDALSENDVLRVKVLSRRVVAILENYGSCDGVAGINSMTLRQFGIESEFSAEVLAAADSCGSVADISLVGGREDFTHLSLVTIDGADAKDFDDAVYAERCVGGYRLVVAIADVGHYVLRGSAMDLEALRRGNSLYLAGLVVPMLPFALSSDLCSLRAGELRYALAVDIRFSSDGMIISYDFKRILMRSRCRLVYEAVDDFLAGGDLLADSGIADASVIESLRCLDELYGILALSRESRGALAIEGGDKRADLDDNGELIGISILRQTRSRKLIEEMMISANICAARFLGRHGLIGLHRNHESPPADKLDIFADVVVGLGYNFNSRHASVESFNALSRSARERGEGEVMEGLILRAQSRAYYATDKVGHFGLGLRDYCHFTSPIRRYADLVVHRAIASCLAGGEGGSGRLGVMELSPIGESISERERLAMDVERAAMDRLSALYFRRLLERSGEADGEFEVIVRSITDFAVFVMVESACLDALLLFSSLPRDYYRVLDGGGRLLGVDSGLLLRLGDRLRVRLIDLDWVLGRVSVSYVSGGDYVGGKEIRRLVGARGKTRGKRGDKTKRKGKRKFQRI